jgi:hypothetical protein
VRKNIVGALKATVGTLRFAVNRHRDKDCEIWEDSRHEWEQDFESILSAGPKEKAAGITGSTSTGEREGDDGRLHVRSRLSLFDLL